MATGIIKQTGWSVNTNFFTPASGYTVYDIPYACKKNGFVWISMGITKSDQSAFSQTRHTVGTLNSNFLPKIGCNVTAGASTGINFFLNRKVHVLFTTSGQVLFDIHDNSDIKQVSVHIMYATDK